MFPGLQEPLDMGQEDVTWREKACTQPQQLPAFLFTVPTTGETHEEKKSLMAWKFQICFAQHRLVHLGQGRLLLDVVVRELLEGLAVDFILQGFGFQGTFKYLVCQLIN